VALVGPASVSAEPPLPVYSGGLSFPTIKQASDPEEYSWQVELHPGQTLNAVDDQHAEVIFKDGTVVAEIRAAPAHDATGAAVPSSLAISEGNIVTLTVHHRAGNPSNGGVPFAYPVSLGSPIKSVFRV
jgi:hypothetical protein